MDRSYIVEAQIKEGEKVKDIIAVVFTNSEPSKGFLADLGFSSISNIHEVKPESKQPTEPTLYTFDRSCASNDITVSRFDWQGKIINSAKAYGEPFALVPPVSGQAADALLYLTKAYVISGLVRVGTRLDPVVGVLFIKPQPNQKTLKPDKNTLANLGLDKIISVDPVSTSAAVAETTFYLFERSPSAKSVTVKTPGPDGKLKRDPEGKPIEPVILNGEPYSFIPPVSGSAADRFVNPRNGLGKSDFPRPASVPPGRPISVRPSSLPPSIDPKASRRNGA